MHKKEAFHSVPYDIPCCNAVIFAAGASTAYMSDHMSESINFSDF